ncbi:MAG TPA: bifunctional diaminohydroxyphosphoribosylaminopyrimidine deaminase/5-amino-6-(5-phosphoribosylamino)uracil reductase RibD [Candidatus Kapabacteria bacterium]|nr:bifunctional diaminohydroxyphosphoribosylaminopyrimidine deaminase/5-amino-6-(5-phosphoribosylamino)uracil reductase RibD [Candidatus Kapabacteria bacterium]
MDDTKFIRRTFELAKMGEGSVGPNPLVGAVIVRNGDIIAEGYHQSFGKPHAEVNAIKNAKDINLAECILYVNLEPCDHIGKTPPCTDLIIKSGFKKVVISNIDPNPMVSGKGIQKLKDNGVEVISDVLSDEGEFLNRIFFKNQTTNEPYIVAKIAQSLDGCIATKDGISKWISNEKSRTYCHLMRSHLDAVMVGKNTILKDNPLLNTRLVAGRNPVKIALDTNLNLALNLSIFKNDDRINTLVLCSINSSTSRKADILRLGGVKLIGCETDTNGKVLLEDAFNKLYNEYHISSVLVEGGPTLHSSLLAENLIDELHVFTAPIIIGDCIKSFAAVKTKNIELSHRFNLYKIENFDGDIHSFYIRK